MTKAITPYNQLKDLVAEPEMKVKFIEMLGPQRGAAFITSMLNVVYNDDNLRDCEPNSVITSTLKAAALDLPIEPSIGMAYIIGYNDNKKKKKFARFQPGYKGYVQLALRTGQYRYLNVAPYCEGEEVTENRLTGETEFTGTKKSDTIIGYVGYLELVTGFKAYEHMTVEEIHEHAQKFSKNYQYSSSAWKTNTAQMEKKTVLLRLLRNHGVLSFSLSETIKDDENGVEPSEPIISRPDDEIVEAVVVDVDPYRPESSTDWAAFFAKFQNNVPVDELTSVQKECGNAQEAYDKMLEQYGEIL